MVDKIMNILIINKDIDSAGVGYYLYEAINKYSSHKARHLCAVKTFFDIDIELEKANFDELVEIIKKTDIFHFNNVGYEIPFGKIRWCEYIKNKKKIFHAHSIHEQGGHLYNHFIRGFIHNKFNEYDKVIECAPCNTWIYRNSIWMPNILPLSRILKYYKPKNFKEQNIIIGQSPTGRNRKNTDDLILVYNSLKQIHKNLTLQIIENVSYEECLKLKSLCHIFFDNMFQGHIGMSGFEAMALGIPVLAYLKMETLEAYKKFSDGDDVPIINVQNNNELYNEINHLLNDRDYLIEISKKSSEWISKYYNEERIVKYWIELYESL